MTPNVKLSIVVPCYNEGRSIPLLLDRFTSAIRSLGDSVELILVENGSLDDSAGLLRDVLHAGKHPFARVVSVPRNEGYGFGVWRGLKAARGDCVAITHADLQCDPKDVVRAFAVFQRAGGDVLVKGARRHRALGEMVFTWGLAAFASMVLGCSMRDANAQPKVFPRSLLRVMVAPPKDSTFDVYVLYCAKRAGLKVMSIPVRFRKRMYGVSSWTSSVSSRIRHVRMFVVGVFRMRFSR
ncbi:MAG: glycosyltransferase family 2 protein [Nanoarchaeota archaeon]